MNVIEFPDAARVFTRPAPIQLTKDVFIDETPAKKKSAAEPLKNIEDIKKIIHYFISTGQYRNNLLFVTGINLGFRCGDLLRFKVGHIIDQNNNFKSEIRFQEEKTKKVRTCYINNAIMDAAELYFNSLNLYSLNPNDYLFTSLSKNCTSGYYKNYSYKEEDSSIDVHSVERMLKNTINNKLNINVHASTHLMRKTFGYHVYMSAPDKREALVFLQKIFQHSSSLVTLSYIGITDDDIKTAYQNLNLGGDILSDICYAAGLKHAI